MEKLIIYGKGGIGKSFVASNISFAFAKSGKRVLHVGCDPKRDSTISLLGGKKIKPVVNLLEDRSMQFVKKEDIIVKSKYGIDCIEAGGPRPGVGCAGYGIGIMFEIFVKLDIVNENDYDVVVYDVLGDVVCGGFASPLKFNFGDKVLIVVSEELMSLYAANNICHAVEHYKENNIGLQGLILNRKQNDVDYDNVINFSKAVRVPIIGIIPRDKRVGEAEAERKPVSDKYPESDIANNFLEITKSVSTKKKVQIFKPISEERLYAFNNWANEKYAASNREFDNDSIETKEEVFKFLISKNDILPSLNSDNSDLQEIYNIVNKEYAKAGDIISRKYHALDNVLLEMQFERLFILLSEQSEEDILNIDSIIDKHIDFPMLLMSNFSVSEEALPRPFEKLSFVIDGTNKKAINDREKINRSKLINLCASDVEVIIKDNIDLDIRKIERVIGVDEIKQNKLKLIIDVQEDKIDNCLIDFAEIYDARFKKEINLKKLENSSIEVCLGKIEDYINVQDCIIMLTVYPKNMSKLYSVVEYLLSKKIKQINIQIELGEYWDKDSHIKYLQQIRNIKSNSQDLAGMSINILSNSMDLFKYNIVVDSDFAVYQYNRLFQMDKYSVLKDAFRLGSLEKDMDFSINNYTHSQFFNKISELGAGQIAEFSGEICSNVDLNKQIENFNLEKKTSERISKL